MIIGALLVGLLTAYYFGIRHGITAASVSAGLFFIAALVPAAQLGIYVLIAAFVAGMCLLGPRFTSAEQQAESKNTVRRVVRKAAGKLWRLM